MTIPTCESYAVQPFALQPALAGAGCFIEIRRSPALDKIVNTHFTIKVALIPQLFAACFSCVAGLAPLAGTPYAMSDP
jgi:hypothetical protein